MPLAHRKSAGSRPGRRSLKLKTTSRFSGSGKGSTGKGRADRRRDGSPVHDLPKKCLRPIKTGEIRVVMFLKCSPGGTLSLEVAAAVSFGRPIPPRKETCHVVFPAAPYPPRVSAPRRSDAPARGHRGAYPESRTHR